MGKWTPRNIQRAAERGRSIVARVLSALGKHNYGRPVFEQKVRKHLHHLLQVVLPSPHNTPEESADPSGISQTPEGP